MRPSGSPLIRARVEHLLATGQAAWCEPVRLELWSGVHHEVERTALRIYQSVLRDLAIRCRKAGKTAPANDVLIAACARHHRVELERADAHFDFLLNSSAG